jgi:8-oxo-dGTP pyrophosphatase MutT (NUDIX family)
VDGLPTDVILAVVQCGGRICLARRSQAVATSRGLWSVVTGYVERGVDPLRQAWTEVQEELGLAPPRLRLRRWLPPVSLTSPASGKRFRVYPFLFECDSAAETVLNWEHTHLAWVEPARLAEPDCVPWQRELVLALLEESHPFG